ncbi:MAG: hypothetical protein IKX48_12035, partial [Victivallales bacterium]|nr:hypothetical protein [Victivallales bacterium]
MGHPAFEFSEPSITAAANILHGDGWSLAGDSVGSTESAVCAFHGALSNRRDLCETFGLPSETTAPELILYIYNQKDADFQHLRGAFSFAILDKSRRKLLLVRDQLGRELLFHAALPNGTHVFSTSLNDLRRLPGFSPQISLKALFDYLSLGYVPSPHTIFHCVSKV